MFFSFWVLDDFFRFSKKKMGLGVFLVQQNIMEFWHISRRVLDEFFRFSKKNGFGVFIVQQNIVETTLPDGLETSGRRA